INSRKENSIVIKVPEIVKKRSKEERKMFREQKYWNYLKNAQSFWLKVDELEVHGLDLKEGRILSKEELKEFSKTLSLNVLYGEDLGKTINLWVDKIPSSKLLENFECLIKERKINVISVSEKRNLILGLLDKDGFLKGIGILRGIDFKKRALKIYAPYFSEIKKIDAGKVKLSKNGKELTH
ncbi:MAG: hypothetical protein QXT31_05640, partial [Candidatus Bathyarchaeia archaeon]